MDDDMEQRVHDLENAQTSLLVQLDVKTARVAELEASNSQLQARLDQTCGNLEREKAEKEAAREGAKEAAREREHKETAIRTVDELRRAATKQEEAYDALDKELENLRGKLRQAERARGDALDEAELKTRELASVNRRASSLQSQCADLERELDERTKALSTYRGEKTQELMKAMSQMAEATRRAEAAESKTAAVQRTADGLQARLTRVESELKAVLEQSAADKAGLERQMALQTNLTNLQKQKADEAMTKIEHLTAEVRRLEGRVATEIDKTAKERKRADDIRDKSKTVVEELKAKFEEKEALAKRNEENAWSTTHSQGANGHGLEAQPVPLDLSVDLNSLTDDELKMRMMKMERELETVRSDRDRHALFLTRILREVDHKSPLLMSSKKDYQRVLQSHEQLFLKVEDSMRRCQRAEVEREEAISSRDSFAKQLETAKDSLADLGAQVQKLLTAKLERDLGRPLERKGDRNGNGNVGAIKAGVASTAIVAGGGNVVPQEPEQVIADHLVTFEDVRQMQERNRMLVQVTRRLTAELKDTKIARNMDQEAHQVKVVDELQREVDELREARKRQLEMLETVTGARDMYRLLLAQETSKDIPERVSSEGGAGASWTSAAAAQEMEATKSRVHELERDSGVARDEIRKLQESLKHLAEDVTTAERAQSKAQAELAATQRMLSHSEDRLKSLVEDRDMRTSTLVRETEKFQKLSDNVVTLQGHLERQKNEAVAAQNEAKDLALTNQALRADKRIIEESEKRLRDENMALRKESRHKDTLVDNLASRDRSVAVHKDAEISTLREELNRLRRQAEKDRRAATDAEMATQKAAAELKDAQRELQMMRSSLQAEAASAKAAAEKAVEAERAASKRSVELAARLQEARARLLTGGGDGGGDGGSGVAVSDEGMSNQLAEIRKLGLELQATKAELKAKEGALATSERQRAQYEAIGKSRQQQMIQLTAAKKKMEEELSARAKEAEARAATAEAEVRSTKTGLASTVAELVREKEASERESAAAQEMVMKLRDELEAVRREVELERGRTDDSKKEMEVQQKAARAAEERYRHELEAHAGAITALRQAEDAQDKLMSERRDAVNAKDALAADLMRARAEWEAREASLKKDYEDAKERLASSKSENDVLHEHLQTLNQQLEAHEKKRQEADKAMAESIIGGNPDSGAGDDPERLRLARSVKELHELVRYKQRDIQVVTMKLEMSTQKVSTLEAELDRAKVSLRETREEVQKAARDNVDAVSKTEHRKLLDEVAQVSTLRESNIMLRNSLREAEDRSRVAESRVKDLERKSAPLQQAERRHAAAAAALASDKASLRREVENWKKRVASLTASFNAVDPKEHDEVVAEKNKLLKALAEAERVKGILENSKAELTRAKAAAEKQRDDVNAVKSRLTGQVADMRKTLDGVRREAASQKATATRDIEAKLSAEKEKAFKATAEALSAKQDAARARNGANAAVKQLNDQLAKAKAETEALKVQLRQPHHSKDGTSMQTEAALRKKIQELEKEKDAVERESTTNRNMYDKMKTVNRNMKENLENFRQQVRDKEDKIAKLQARASELEEGPAPQSAPSSLDSAPAPSSSTSTLTSSSFGATAVPSADATASAGRPQTRPVSPTPSGGRSLTPTASARTDPSAVAMAVDDSKGEGRDGVESALRNRLMSRSKRPLAPPSETSAPAKRAHKQADEPTSSVAYSAVTADPTFLPGDTAKPPAPSCPTSTINSTSVSASSTTATGSTVWLTTPTKPAFSASLSAIGVAPSKNLGLSLSGGATSDASSSAAAPVGASAPAPSTSSLNPSAIPFGVDAGGWAGSRRLGAGTTVPPPSSSSPAPAPAPASAAPSTFGDMTGWGGPRRSTSSIPASSSARGSTALTDAVASAVVLSSTTVAETPSAPAASAGGASREADAGGASGASGEGQGGAQGGGGDEGWEPGEANAPSAAGGVFGSGKGFTGFGGGGRFGGTNVASMKPPSKDAQFPIFPKINLPVPSGTKSGSTGVPFPPPPAPSSATSAFNAPAKPAAGTSGVGISLQQPQQLQSPFGSGSVSQGKFGLSSAPAPSFGSGIPAFGSGVPAFGSDVPSFGKSATSASASPSTTIIMTSGARGSDSEAAGADVVPTGTADSAEAAAAGMPGPGALMLDVEARRAAREKRFAIQPPVSAAGSNQATWTAPFAAAAASATAASSAPGTAASTGTSSAAVSKAGGSDGTKNAAQSHHEDGDIDEEEDEGDPV